MSRLRTWDRHWLTWGVRPRVLPDAGLPPDMLALVREKWREATTDPAPVLAAIKAMQDQLFQGNYKKNAALAVGNGFPAWEDLRRVVARERVQGAAREPLFRMVALPAQPDTFVIWDRLRLEGGDGPPLVFAEHPELGAAIEQASGLKFGQHPQGRPVPKSALVTAAGAEVVIDLRKLPAELQKALTLPRFLRADVSLDEASPETSAVQAFLIAATGGGGRLAEPVAKATLGDPLAAQIVHPRVAAERARPAAEFRALFPPAVLFQPIIPRDAQGSVFLYRREDEPLRRLLLDDAGRAELDRLWSELEFVSEQALATPIAYEGLVQYYRKPNDGARIMFFYIQVFEEQIKREEKAFLAAQVAAEPRHLEALLAFAARAWRRPLADDEREAILASYRADRTEGVKHDPAFRAALARVLSSPWFLYRVEQPATGPRWQPVSGDELATRLSFLLWDSIPDDELRAKAAKLHEPAVMEEQLRRMLKDGRMRGMAEEFGARWLGRAGLRRQPRPQPEALPRVHAGLARRVGRRAGAVLRRPAGQRPPGRRRDRRRRRGHQRCPRQALRHPRRDRSGVASRREGFSLRSRRVARLWCGARQAVSVVPYEPRQTWRVGGSAGRRAAAQGPARHAAAAGDSARRTERARDHRASS